MGGCKSWQPWFRERAEREAEMRKLRVTWELGQWIRDRMSAPVHISPQSNKYWPV